MHTRPALAETTEQQGPNRLPTIVDYSQPNLVQEMMRLEFTGKLDDVPFDKRIKLDF